LKKIRRFVDIFFRVSSPYAVFRNPRTIWLFAVVKVNNYLNLLFRRVHNSEKVECNLCGWRGNKFLIFWDFILNHYRRDAMCPSCYSLERHRLLLEYLKNEVVSSCGKNNLLHIGPDEAFESYFTTRDDMTHVSIDLESNNCMAKMDLTALAFSANRFDVFLCSHVLEHIKQDIEAMKELFRVLKRGGAGITQVPIDLDLKETVEYEQPDEKNAFHVRMYGLDIEERLQSVGFKVERINYVRQIYPKQAVKLGLKDEIFFRVTKPSDKSSMA